MFYNGERGFTLVETMVGIGILGIISLTAVKLVGLSSQAKNKMEFSAEANQLISTITSTLANSEACSKSFVEYPIGNPLLRSPINPAAAAAAISAIRDAAGASVAATSSVYGSKANTFTITSMIIRDVAIGTGQVAPALANLSITLQKTQGGKTGGTGLIGGSSTVRSIPIMVLLNGSNNIIRCFTSAEQFGKATCSALGGQNDLITGECSNLDLNTEDYTTPNYDALITQGDLVVNSFGPMTGDLTNTSGDINAGVDISSAADVMLGGNLSSTSGNITATAGAGNIAASNIAATESMSLEGDLVANQQWVINQLTGSFTSADMELIVQNIIETSRDDLQNNYQSFEDTFKDYILKRILTSIPKCGVDETLTNLNYNSGTHTFSATCRSTSKCNKGTSPCTKVYGQELCLAGSCKNGWNGGTTTTLSYLPNSRCAWISSWKCDGNSNGGYPILRGYQFSPQRSYCCKLP